MDTIKIDKNNVKLIAHRGVSGIERENTAAAFVAAGNRSYYGIETDVHVTKDGKFVIIHDDDSQRVYGEAFSVEGSDFSLLRSLRLTDKNGEKREDLCLPEPGEYLRICKTYNKTAVLELKNQMPEKQIREIYEVIKKEYHLEKMIFISFCYENLAVLRSMDSAVRIQLLTSEEVSKKLIEALKKYNLGLDIYYERLTAENVKELKQNGIAVNCWTVDDKSVAERLISYGVDFITTDILE